MFLYSSLIAKAVFYLASYELRVGTISKQLNRCVGRWWVMQGELILPTCSEVSVSPPGSFLCKCRRACCFMSQTSILWLWKSRWLSQITSVVWFVCFFATVVLDKCYYHEDKCIYLYLFYGKFPRTAKALNFLAWC